MRAQGGTATGVIDRLAPTGEGVARLRGKAVFVEGALPGEEVDFEIFEEKPRFSRARAVRVRSGSPDRRPTDGHSARCGGTDWAHFEVAAAREAKRILFREVLERIGRIPAEALGELPVGASPLEYRLRNQFHLQLIGGRLRWGFFEKRSRRVVPLNGCEIVSAATRGKMEAAAPEAGRALAEGETLKLETLETIETGAAHRVAFGEKEKLELRLPQAAFRVSAGSFFQVNRFRVPALYEQVRRRAAQAGGTTALDAFAGVGLFSRALLDAGYRVTAVEADAAACADAAENRKRWAAEDCLTLVGARIEDYAACAAGPFDLVLADPPRGGLRKCAALLAGLAARSFVYVSCEPATLARDLRVLRDLGFRIDSALLEDFFPLTHRIEACVVLHRNGSP